MSTTTDYTVVGMTCGGCARKVTGAVETLSGVDETDVDIATGVLTVTGTAIDDSAVKAAIVTAGYRVA